MLNRANLLELVITYDNEGHILSANRQALRELGYDNKEIKKLRLGDIIGGEGIVELDGTPVKFNCQKEIANLIAYRKNRTVFPLFVRILPARSDEELNVFLALNRQTQYNLEKEIMTLKIEADNLLKSRNDFIANMTHELRTPVNGIRGHISAMLNDSTNASDRKTYTIIKKCCEDMMCIINNILDFSKLDAGKFELTHEVFDIYELLNHIVTANLAVINEKGIRIILNIADNVPREVYGDGLRIRQILNNLVSNAVKFTDIGYVSIDVNKHSQIGDDIELFFLVRDTGIGISQEDTDKLFKSFSQVDASSTRAHGGTGLGLMISKELVELMGGKIRVESTVGKGSSFSFSIHLNTPEHADKCQENSPPETAVEEHENRPPETPDGIFDQDMYENIMQNLSFDLKDIDSIYQYGTPDNVREIQKKCDVLVLALELEAWDKAETISENLKKLVVDGPEDLKKMVFRLGMVIRKEDDEKSRQRFEILRERLENEYA
jgi:signal transduction histidine kinase